MSLEELIDKIVADGYRINNLCQLQSGQWQANVHQAKVPGEISSGDYWQYGLGSTAKEALHNCHQRAIVELKFAAAPKTTNSLYLQYVVNAGKNQGSRKSSSGTIKLEDL